MTYKEYFESLSEEEQKASLIYLQIPVELKNIEGRLEIPFYYGIDNEEIFPNIHELKTLPEYFKPAISLEKKFEIRKDDRDYQVGDWVVLEEWDGEKFTGNFVQTRIRYILRNCPEYGLADGFCILGF